MASGKRKRNKGKQTKGRYEGSASAHRRARQTLPTYMRGEPGVIDVGQPAPLGESRTAIGEVPIGYTAPERELAGLPEALEGYSGDDQIPIVITTDPDAP